MLHIPNPRQRMRWLTILYGLTAFFWLSVEDNAVWPVAIFGLFLASLLAARTLFDRVGGKTITGRHAPILGLLIGALIGMGTSVTTAGLMLLKNALHSHLFPDYPPGQMIALLERAPVWALAGGLAGLGFSFAWIALRREISGYSDGEQSYS